ncbi:MAG: hypothetical protein EOM76_08360 [Sphingobacteriia bacterium]|nr:hypothetical protein [Sphingobacteriia bacterium]
MKLKLPILFLVCAVLVAGFGAAALSTVSIERNVTAGTVLADTDSNVAVKFEASGTFQNKNVLTTDNAGKVAIELGKLLKNNQGGFNTAAQFTIGSSQNDGVYITNNTDVAVKVSLPSTGGLSLCVDNTTVDNNGYSLSAGDRKLFYFKLDTTGINKNTAISGTLSVKKTA